MRSQDGGRVVEILSGEGRIVGKGDLILRLDNADIESRATEAEQQLSTIVSDAKAAQAELSRATKERAARAAIVEEDRRLLEKDALSRASYESDLVSLKTSDAALDAARARTESLAEAPGSRLELARAHANALAKRRQALVVRAPRKGVVYGLPRRVGEEVGAGDVIANVTDPDRPQLRARVDEPDLPRVKEGQGLLVTFDGLPDLSFKGAVTSVSPSLRDSGGRQVGEVLGEIQDADHRLPLNASVNVEIIVGERASVLVVPRTAIRRDGAARYVFLLEDGRAERREVSVGLVGLSEVEVVSGLKAGDRVILPGGADLKEGARVVSQ